MQDDTGPRLYAITAHDPDTRTRVKVFVVRATTPREADKKLRAAGYLPGACDLLNRVNPWAEGGLRRTQIAKQVQQPSADSVTVAEALELLAPHLRYLQSHPAIRKSTRNALFELQRALTANP
jgi:hypothetical protein